MVYLVLLRTGDVSSIGTASDLQQSDSDDEDDEDEGDDDDDDDDDCVSENGEKFNEKVITKVDNQFQIGEERLNETAGPSLRVEEDSDDEDFELVNFDQSVSSTRFRYGRVSDRHQPAISRIKISAAATVASDTASDTTSVSINEPDDSSRLTEKSADTIDHLIGHIEGHRPLLDDEEEEEAEQTSAMSMDSSIAPSSLIGVRPFIQMDTPPVLGEIEQSSGRFQQNKPPPFVPATNFEAFTLQQIIDETEENLKLDQEVEESLTQQVIRDQMNHKDLFGSIPFTDKDLMVICV